MRSNFFVPRHSIEETTGPNWLKFCMGPPRGLTRWIVEGFFEIRSGGPDKGYPWSHRRGPKILKNFVPISYSFSTGIPYWMSKSHIIVKLNPSLVHSSDLGVHKDHLDS